jgi:chromosome segregation ATPase
MADNIVLEHLRHIRNAVDGLRDDMREVKQRLGLLEDQHANLAMQYANLSAQYANMSNRLDRIDARVERIEQRLGLVEV